MRVKSAPKHAVVIPQKCVVTIYRNPIQYVVHRRREFFLLDQQKRDAKKVSDYKQHVHAPPKNNNSTDTVKKTTDSGRYQRTAGAYE